MKFSIILAIFAAMLFGGMPVTAEAKDRHHHRHGHHDRSYRAHHDHHRHGHYRRVYHHGYWSWRHHHRVWVPARYITVYF